MESPTPKPQFQFSLRLLLVAVWAAAGRPVSFNAMFPTTHPYLPGDVLATVYDFLGIDPAREFHDQSGRPTRILDEGRPIAELFS